MSEDRELLYFKMQLLQAEPTPINWIEAQKAYSANGRKPVVLHDGLYEVEIRRSYDKQMQEKEPCEWCKPSEQENYKGVRPLDFVSLMEFDGWNETKSDMGKFFCSNCGRDLREDIK